MIVQAVFTDVYNDPGIVLGLVGIATTLYAGISIWLNYALSLDRHNFVMALAILVVFVIGAMGFFHDSVVIIASIMITAGVAGNLAGAVTTLPGRWSIG